MIDKYSSSDLEKIEKKICLLRTFYPELTVDEIIILTKAQILALGAILGLPVISGITPPENPTDSATYKTALRSLQIRQIYFPHFTGVGNIDKSVTRLITALGSPGLKNEFFVNYRVGKVIKFNFSFSSNLTVMTFNLTDSSVVVCDCKGVNPSLGLKKNEEISCSDLKKIKKIYDESFDSNAAKEELKKINSDDWFVKGIIDCINVKSTSGLICQYEFDGITFSNFNSSIAILNNNKIAFVSLK